MAEVKWTARRISDGVLVDVTGDTRGTPSVAPTANELEAGGQQQMIAQNGARIAQLTVEATGGEASVISEVDDGTGKTGRLELIAPGGSFLDRADGVNSARVTVEPGFVRIDATESPSSTSLTIHGADGLQLNDTPFTRAAAVANLSVSVGTSDGTVADVGAAFNQTTLNNNFRDVSDKLNALLAALRTAGLIST